MSVTDEGTGTLWMSPVVGGVEADRVRIGLRARGPSHWRVRVYEEGSQEPFWVSEAQSARMERGFTVVFQVLGLKPDTVYRYEVENAETGQRVAQGRFASAPPLGQPQPFVFSVGATFLPGAPGVSPKALEVAEPRGFVFLLGNPVCADAWRANGLGRIPETLEDYRTLYRQAWASEAWRRVFARMPVFAIWGHRVVDWGWSWADVDRTEARLPWGLRLLRRLRRMPGEVQSLSRRRVVAAMQAYWEHLGQISPPLLMPPEGVEDLGRPLVLPADRGHFGYAFSYGAAAFLVLDIHTHRVVGRLGCRWLHPEQWQALEGWLASVQAAYPLKFVVTPAAVFARGAGDFWMQNVNALRRLLHVVAARQVEGVVFLSHGLEAGWVVEAELNADGVPVTVWEIGVGAMSPGHRPWGTWRPFRWVSLPQIQALRVRVPPLWEPQVVHIGIEWPDGPRLQVRFHDGVRTWAEDAWTL